MRKPALLLSAIVAASASGLAHSQALEEVIVTAQKRSENMQDVPIAITGIAGSALEDGRVQTTMDLQFQVPSLNFGFLSVFSKIYLRGIGTDITLQGAEPAVATYVDGISVPGQVGNFQGLLGVERIEVLSGPQGTLYGRNAVGGAISLYTLTPKQETEAKLSLTGGNFSRGEVTGHVSGGITDNLAVGIYGAYTKRDTFLHITRVDAPGWATTSDLHDEPSDELQYGVRLKAVWTPTDTLTVTGSVDRIRLESVEGTIFRNIQDNAFGYAFSPYTGAAAAGNPINIPGFVSPSVQLSPFNIKKYRYEANDPNMSVQRGDSAMLRVEWEQDFGKLVSITGFRKWIGQGADDVDGTAAPLFWASSRDWGQRTQSFSQEVQWLSPSDSKVDWILGAYVYNERSGFQPNDSSGILVGAGVAPTAPATWLDYRLTNYATVRAKSGAIFGQATLPLDNVAEGLRLTAGARYTIDTKDIYGVRQELDTPAGRMVLPGPYPNETVEWRKFTPKLTLDYKPGNTMYYATWAKGFKSGMYNTSQPLDVLKQGAVDPETLTDYEIGTKSDLMDGRLRINTSAWWYNFKNIQVNKVDTSSGAVSASVQNAASARVVGAEATVNFAATERLTLNGGLSVLNSKFTKFPNAQAVNIYTGPCCAPNAGAVVDATHNSLVRTPKYVVNGSVDYRMPLNGGELAFNLSGYYNDGYYFDTANQLKQPSYEIFDAFVQYSFPGDKISVKLWGKNLGDKYYYNELQNLLNVIAIDAMRRNYGITLDYSL